MIYQYNELLLIMRRMCVMSELLTSKINQQTYRKNASAGDVVESIKKQTAIAKKKCLTCLSRGVDICEGRRLFGLK